MEKQPIPRKAGGSRGIGKAIALALAAEGVNIGIIGRTGPALTVFLNLLF